MAERKWTLVGLLATLLLVTAPSTFGQVATTTVQDTVYSADGGPAAGTVLVTWSAFTTPSGAAVAAGTTSATIGSNGLLSIALVPNAGASPTGSYYTAVFHLSDGTTSKQYWVVPAVGASSTVTLAAIENQVLPTSVAVQTASKSYVDNAIAEAVATGIAPSASGSGSTQYVPTTGGTMTGPLLLPGDPVSVMQAADKNYVDENVAQVASGMATKVSSAPTAAQTVNQPAGTQMEVNRLNGELDASGFLSGLGNNGFANALASTDCSSGCAVVAGQGYPGMESVPTSVMPSGAQVRDDRGGAVSEYFQNPLAPNNSSSIGWSATQVSTRTEPQMVALRPGIQGANNQVMSLTATAPTGGSNQFPASVESVPYNKSNFGVLQLTGNYNTQGQHVQFGNQLNCWSVGDCLAGGQFIQSAGGYRDAADEGTHPFDLEVQESPTVFMGNCSSGCTTGSTSVVVNATAGAGSQGDGRFLIDKNPSKVISAGALNGAGSGLFLEAGFSGVNFPVSVFLQLAQAATSQAGNLAPGTVTLQIMTSGVQGGVATSTAALPASKGIACVADPTSTGVFPNFETATYATIDTTHVQLTLNKVHAAGAVVAVGGMCGYGLEQTVDTYGPVKQVFPVVGSLSGSAVYYAQSQTGVLGYSGLTNTSGYLSVSLPITSVSRNGNTVTLTTGSSFPYDLNGLSLTVSGVSDGSYNGTFTVATTGSNTLTYTNPGANSSSSGGTLSMMTGGYNLYPMAEVLNVYNAGTASIDGTLTLAPNTVAWAAGDAVEEPHFYQELVYPDTELVTQYVPRPIQLVAAGKSYSGENGPGLRGWQISNLTPASTYLGGGGTHQPPDDAYVATGVWRNTFEVQAGQESLLKVHCNGFGCNRWDSQYALLSMDSHQGSDFLFYNPASNSVAWDLAGINYSFSPQGFTAGTVNAGTLNTGGLTASSFSMGANSPAYPFQLGTNRGPGELVWSGPGVLNPWFGIYDPNGGTYYGISASLPSPAGTSTLGGFFSGLGLSATTANTGKPVFGVLNSAQQGMFILLDDGSGNTAQGRVAWDSVGDLTVSGKMAAGKGLGTGTASNTDLAGTLVLAAGATSSAALTFANSYANAPVCMVQPQNATAATVQALGGVAPQVSTTGLSVNVGTAPGASVVFGYSCVSRN